MTDDLNKLKSEFISTVSHELRTPLAIIKQLLLLIYNEIPGSINDEQREILVKVHNNIDRLKNTIDKLLDISNLEGQGLKLRYSLVNINDLLKEREDFFKELAKEKNIHFRYQLPTKECSIFIDAERFVQIVTNLITNAIKFTKEGGNIRVELKMLEDKLRVGVMDTGIGIAPSNLSKIFHKFVQVSGDEELNKKGIGLGLSIVRELVEKHGGEIWIESKLGGGSRFYFTLPRFHTAHLLDPKTKKTILKTLSQGKSLYLLNASIINYDDFYQKRVNKLKSVTHDFKNLIKSAFQSVRFRELSFKELFISKIHHGRYSIIFPKRAASKVHAFCNLLRDMTKHYFKEHKREDIYVALGVMSFTPKDKKNLDKSLVSRIKEMYIGSEVRRFKRIRYKTGVELIFSKRKKENSQSEDISLGGLCIHSHEPLKTDTKLKVRLNLIKKKQPITAAVRVSWVRPLGRLDGDEGEYYKVGLEFMAFQKNHKEILLQELKLYYE